MNAKIFVFLMATLILARIHPVEAQQPAQVLRIGYLEAVTRGSNFQRFLEGLREHGYVEGQNLVIEHRSAEGKTERYPDLVADLLRVRIDVIATGATTAALAAKRATTAIPIIVIGVGEPVETGLVASLERPGGNVTGLSSTGAKLAGKRLEILKEAFPGVSRVAVFWNSTNPSNAALWKETQSAARTVELQVQSLEVRASKDVEPAFERAIKEGAQALVVARDGLLNQDASQKQIRAFAAKGRLPVIYGDRQFAEAGGLMSFAPDISDIFRRGATYVDKIFKGAKPADLPVEEPARVELVINLRTAKELGLTISPSVLKRADRVIK